jgi:hypothetical protein
VIVLVGLQVTLLAGGAAFLYLSSKTMGQCYALPCYLTPGMDRVFEVDSGLSFSMILIGGCFTLHPFFGLIMTRTYKRVDAFSGGVFVGFSILNAVNALASAVFWNAKVRMASDLATSIPDRVSDPLTVNPEAEPLFRKLSYTSGIYFILEALLIAVLVHANNFPFSPAGSNHVETGKGGHYVPVSRSAETASLMHSSPYQNPFHDDDAVEGPSVSI